jgi:DNA-binding MarR family transcriptional regulator
MIEVHMKNEARLLEGLSERERTQLARLLAKLAASFG